MNKVKINLKHGVQGVIFSFIQILLNTITHKPCHLIRSWIPKDWIC